MTRRASRSHAAAGFTLMEVLAAFAITASIIMGVGSLVHHVGLSFDRGIVGVNEAERFSLAMDRLSRDFAAVHFVSLAPGPDKAADKNPKTALHLAFKAGSHEVTFVSSTNMNGMRSEVVTLSVETFDNDVSQLVRRTSAWPGPGFGLFSEAKGNTVVLMKGRYTISFSYGQLTKNGTLSWSQSWQDDGAMPAAVRLNLRDPQSGANLLAGADFILRSDYPAACVGDVQCPLGKPSDKDKQTQEQQTL